MYRRYARCEGSWLESMQSVKEFIADELCRHVSTWPRHGRLGVPADLNCQALCALLPAVVEQQSEFGLLLVDGVPRLLVLPALWRGPEPLALCYGAWPGIDVWQGLIERHLPAGVDLSRTRWNEMPSLIGADVASRGAAPVRI